MSDKKDLPAGNANLGDYAQGNAAFTGGVGQDFVQGNKIINEAPKSGLPALHQLEPPPLDFVGREAELSELLTLVKQGGVTISGLQGLGGVGKTTLALKLASLLKDQYPDAQFFLDLKGPEQQPLPATEALKHVIRGYNPTAMLPESLAELRGLYFSVLDGKRVLLLMDNARDETQIEPLLPPPGCLLLVTSRFNFTVPGLKVKSLNALPPEDAVKLLLEIAPRIGDQASEIARLCGNLPLGLRLAASFLSTRRNYKVAEYVRRLRESNEQLRLIEASLNLSYELLREDLQASWRALAVFPDSFDQRAAAAIWQLDEDVALERLGELLSFSLVEWSEETDRYLLHDLVRVFANSRMAEAEKAISQYKHATHYQVVLTLAEDLYISGFDRVRRGLALFDLERANIEAGQAWASANANSNQLAAELCVKYPDYGTNLLSLRHLPQVRAQWRETMLCHTQRLQMREAEGRALRNLGIAYRHLGESQRAIEFYEQALIVIRETGDRKAEGHILGGLGLAYMDLGINNRALEFFEQRLAMAREMNDHYSESNALGNLGVFHMNLGDIHHAIKLFEQRLVITIEIGDLRGEGDARWNNALALYQLDHRAPAIVSAEAALLIYEQIGHYSAPILREKLQKWLEDEK